MKKVPMRMCLGCREMKPKKDIIRVVKSPEGEVSFDTTGKKPGRGAYLCRDANCFNRVIKSNALSRAFKTQIHGDVIDQLKSEIANNKGQPPPSADGTPFVREGGKG